MSYRWAAPGDAEELALLNQQLVQDGADFGPDNLEFLTRRMRDWLSDRAYRAVLFKDGGGHTVAYAVFRDSGEEIYLAQFLVVKNARGHGIGHAAIDLLRKEIWQSGKRLILDVLIDNRPALEFWHQLGWKDCVLTLEIPVQRDSGRCDPAAPPPPAAALSPAAAADERGQLPARLAISHAA